ncbi:MAG: hypothetical protein WC683_11845 [bacterium]
MNGSDTQQPVYYDAFGRQLAPDGTPVVGDPRKMYGDDGVYNMYVHRAMLAATEYRKDLVDRINAAGLFMETKRTLTTIVMGAFDKTNVLAKLPDIEISKMYFEIIMIEAKQSFPPCDRDNPEFGAIYSMILDHYDKFISRAADGWERALQNKIETCNSQSVNYSVRDSGQAPQQDGRGLRISNPLARR